MAEVSVEGVSGAVYPESAADKAQGSAKVNGGTFAVLLSEIIQQKATSMLMGSSSGSGGLSGMSGSLFGSDMELGLMAALLSQVSDGGGLSPDTAQMLISSLTGMGFGNTSIPVTTPDVTDGAADTLASGSYAVSAPAYSGGQAVPASAWLPTSPQVTGSEGGRSAKLLDDVIEQFHVETSERYRPHRYGSDTYCNIFVWDVTSAMGAEVPHYVDAKTGAPRTYPDVAGATELDANGVCRWLGGNGAAYGWKAVGAQDAQNYANSGYPVVAAWENASGGAGHVQIVCPSRDGKYNAAKGVAVAQAGGKNYEYAHMDTTLGPGRMPEARYYVHA